MAFKMRGFSAFTKKTGGGKSDTIRVPNHYNVGDYVSEDDFEAQFKKTEGDASTFPQLSVQDYSKVKEDDKGKYVTKLKK